MATCSSILAWRIKWTEEPGYNPWGHKEIEHDLVIKQQQQQPICGSKITCGFCLLFGFFMMLHRIKFQPTASPY